MKKYKRKERQKKEQMTKEKKTVNGKVLARFLWVVILVWLVLTVVSFVRMNAVANNNAALQKEVTNLKESTENVN